MLMDETLEFSDAGVVATATGKTLHGDVVDLGIGRDVGVGDPLYVVVTIADAITSGGAATLSFEVVSDAQAAILVDGTETRHAKTTDFSLAELAQGQIFVIPLPPEFPAYEQFLGLITNVGTAVLTGGAINAFITRDRGTWKAYPDSPLIN